MKFHFLKAVAVVAFLFFSFQVHAQITINEVCNANDSVVHDEDGDFEDWFELHNAGSSPVNLLKYSLTCVETKTVQWTFPDVTIAPNSQLLVYASGKGRKTFINHWETPINTSTLWRYLGGNTPAPAQWKDVAFNDAAWTQAKGSLGYGDGDDTTTVASTISLYMRRKFNLPDTAVVGRSALYMDYDDGFVAYLNGVEIARSNVGIENDTPAYNTPAHYPHEAQIYQGRKGEWFHIDNSLMKSLIKSGNNVLAIEMHNAYSQVDDLTANVWFALGNKDTSTKWSWIPINSSGLHTDFTFSSGGQTLILKDSLGAVVDQAVIGALQRNHSRARIPDGSTTWCLTDKPTPATTNSTSVCYSGYSAAPVLSPAGGFYSGIQTLTISATAGAVIRYTRDGDEPTVSSPVYSGPLTIDSTQVIRAKSWESGKLASLTTTNSYFINENFKLPVISISSDSSGLWDYQNGIYVMGPDAQTNVPNFGANFWMDWERPMHIEYYDTNKVQGFELDAGLKIHGGFSRTFPQRSFRVEANDDYGTKEINYKLFPNRTYTKIKNFNIRNFGIDWNTTCMRDGLIGKIMTPTGMETMDQQPCIVFLNGQFWGMYEIREKEDKYYLEQLRNADPDSIDLLKINGMVQEGSNTDYLNMMDFISTQNMAVQANYDSVNKMLDIPNTCDYFITEIFFANQDWPANNIKYWRPNDQGKWRYILWDVDFAYGLLTNLYKNYCTYNFLDSIIHPAFPTIHSVMLGKLLTNTDFKNYFINRYADLINTIYYPTNVKKALAKLKGEMLPDMPRHFAKWGNSWPNPYGAASAFDIPSWNKNLDTILYYMDNRPFHARNHIESQFSLPKQVNVTLDVSPAGAGKIKISTIIPDSLPWNGVYFDGVPVAITALPNPGYIFDHWQSNVLIPTPNTSTSVTLTITSNDAFTAYFKVNSVEDLPSEVLALSVNPNPFSGDAWINYTLLKNSPVTLRVYSMIGEELQSIELGAQSSGEHLFHFEESGLPPGIYFLELQTLKSRKTVKIAKSN